MKLYIEVEVNTPKDMLELAEKLIVEFRDFDNYKVVDSEDISWFIFDKLNGKLINTETGNEIEEVFPKQKQQK